MNRESFFRSAISALPRPQYHPLRVLVAHGIAFSITYTRALHIGDDSIANLCRVGLARLHSACAAASGGA
ncbi:hypothetical protein [Nitrosomonas sp. Nm34]|uniref:hypothetical protein n=1 Tax=Nitrosomonas sp. Nm34 TaxID=1881055 RepID=UPI000B89F5E1|nr:hypothetical protein [Nitrosomonas sp. Nm34]